MKAMINRYREATPEAGDDTNESIREALIHKYAHLVKYFTEKYALRLPPHITKDELQSAGTLGLLDALNHYDPDKGVKFQTYASYRIRGAIFDELRKIDWVPRTVRGDIQKIEEAIAALQHRMGHEPDDKDIAQELNVDIDTYHKMLQRAHGVKLISLDEVKPGGVKPLFDKLVSDEPTPFDAFKRTELKQVIANALSKLSQKEQTVMSLYYYEDLTLKEIAAVLGLTESRISQIHSKVVIALRARLKSYFESE
jgi:RNA polymerase sigma factor for flagellar operon FliA